MTNDDKQTVRDRVCMEGFDYTFREYSDFREIDDKTFHALRLAYIMAADDLEAYIESDDDS